MNSATAQMLPDTVRRATREAVAPGHSLVGVDLVNMLDFERQLRLAGVRLRARLFSAQERDFCGADIQRLASTLAGKEAVAKVLGTGFRGGVRFRDIQILRTPTGRPYAKLTGGAQQRADAIGLHKLAVSLCHEPPFAVAVAMGTSGHPDQ
jgi:holo-[acyl-carrier protein] synthase